MRIICVYAHICLTALVGGSKVIQIVGVVQGSVMFTVREFLEEVKMFRAVELFKELWIRCLEELAKSYHMSA